MKKNLTIIKCVLITLIVIFGVYCYFPINSTIKYSNLFYMVDVPNKIELGDTVKIKAAIKNTSARSFNIIHNGSMLKIYVYNELDLEPVETSLAVYDIFAAGQKVSESLEYTFKEKGNYVIEIFYNFSSNEKNEHKEYYRELYKKTIKIE